MENKYFSKPMTHGRLKDVLLSLGFRRYISPAAYSPELEYTLPDAVVYKHDKAGALIVLPVLTLGTKLDGAHQGAAADDVAGFGVLSKEKFNAMLTAPAEPRAVKSAAVKPKRETADAPERELAEAAA